MSYSRRGSASLYSPSGSSTSSSSKSYPSSYMVPASALSNLLFRTSTGPTPTPTQAAYLSHSSSGLGSSSNSSLSSLVFQPRSNASRSRSIHGGTPAASSDRSYTRSKYDTSTPEKSPAVTPTSYRSSRASSISSVTSEKEAETPQDWKKMYEQEKLENDKLRKRLTEVEKDLSDTKADNHKYSNVNRPNALSESEKRERRAMERKMAEMEEELKELETLRADNQRLKDENGALIRVISKLSK